MPRISYSKLQTCKYCKARTSRNIPCKRLSACHVGCRNFCAQHAEKLGGTIRKKNSRVHKCHEPKISICNKHTTSFPCKKKLTYFWSRKSYEKYRKLNRKSRVQHKRSNMSIIRSYKKRHSQSPITKTRSRRIKFVSI